MVTRTQYAPCIATTQTVRSPLGALSPGTRLVKVMSGSRELPMPNITRISSLSQAHATLLHCFARLTRAIGDAGDAAVGSPQRRALDNERWQLQQWLNLWEAAFTAFLSSAMGSMTAENISQSRVLKTNHLACSIRASDSATDSPDAFESEYAAIVELAGAVLRGRQQSPNSNSFASDVAAPLRGLDVREPLKMVSQRCRQEAIRNRAREVYTHFYPNEGA